MSDTPGRKDPVKSQDGEEKGIKVEVQQDTTKVSDVLEDIKLVDESDLQLDSETGTTKRSEDNLNKTPPEGELNITPEDGSSVSLEGESSKTEDESSKISENESRKTKVKQDEGKTSRGGSYKAPAGESSATPESGSSEVSEYVRSETPEVKLNNPPDGESITTPECGSTKNPNYESSKTSQDDTSNVSEDKPIITEEDELNVPPASERPGGERSEALQDESSMSSRSDRSKTPEGDTTGTTIEFGSSKIILEEPHQRPEDESSKPRDDRSSVRDESKETLEDESSKMIEDKASESVTNKPTDGEPCKALNEEVTTIAEVGAGEIHKYESSISIEDGRNKTLVDERRKESSNESLAHVDPGAVFEFPTESVLNLESESISKQILLSEVKVPSTEVAISLKEDTSKSEGIASDECVSASFESDAKIVVNPENDKSVTHVLHRNQTDTGMGPEVTEELSSFSAFSSFDLPTDSEPFELYTENISAEETTALKPSTTPDEMLKAEMLDIDHRSEDKQDKNCATQNTMQQQAKALPKTSEIISKVEEGHYDVDEFQDLLRQIEDGRPIGDIIQEVEERRLRLLNVRSQLERMYGNRNPQNDNVDHQASINLKESLNVNKCFVEQTKKDDLQILVGGDYRKQSERMYGAQTDDNTDDAVKYLEEAANHLGAEHFQIATSDQTSEQEVESRPRIRKIKITVKELFKGDELFRQMTLKRELKINPPDETGTVGVTSSASEKVEQPSLQFPQEIFDHSTSHRKEIYQEKVPQSPQHVSQKIQQTSDSLPPLNEDVISAQTSSEDKNVTSTQSIPHKKKRKGKKQNKDDDSKATVQGNVDSTDQKKEDSSEQLSEINVVGTSKKEAHQKECVTDTPLLQLQKEPAEPEHEIRKDTFLENISKMITSTTEQTSLSPSAMISEHSKTGQPTTSEQESQQSSKSEISATSKQTSRLPNVQEFSKESLPPMRIKRLFVGNLFKDREYHIRNWGKYERETITDPPEFTFTTLLPLERFQDSESDSETDTGSEEEEEELQYVATDTVVPPRTKLQRMKRDRDQRKGKQRKNEITIQQGTTGEESAGYVKESGKKGRKHERSGNAEKQNKDASSILSKQGDKTESQPSSSKQSSKKEKGNGMKETKEKQCDRDKQSESQSTKKQNKKEKSSKDNKNEEKVDPNPSQPQKPEDVKNSSKPETEETVEVKPNEDKGRSREEANTESSNDSKKTTGTLNPQGNSQNTITKGKRKRGKSQESGEDIQNQSEKPVDETSQTAGKTSDSSKSQPKDKSEAEEHTKKKDKSIFKESTSNRESNENSDDNTQLSLVASGSDDNTSTKEEDQNTENNTLEGAEGLGNMPTDSGTVSQSMPVASSGNQAAELMQREGKGKKIVAGGKSKKIDVRDKNHPLNVAALKGERYAHEWESKAEADDRKFKVPDLPSFIENKPPYVLPPLENELLDMEIDEDADNQRFQDLDCYKIIPKRSDETTQPVDESEQVIDESNQLVHGRQLSTTVSADENPDASISVEEAQTYPGKN